MSHRPENRTVLFVVVSVVLVVGVAGAVSASNHHGGEGNAYAGSHVSFDTSENAVVNYTVDGATIFERARVESRSSAEERGGAGIGVGTGGSLDLSSLKVRGAAVANVNAQARASARVDFEGSAEFEAHDNGNGVAVLKSGGVEQVVEVDVPSDAEAQVSSNSVVSFTDDGNESSLIVAGEGDVEINDGGNATARLEGGTNAVVRTYGDEKTEDDEEQERLIADGDVATEVQFSENSGEVIGDSADFLSNTSVETEVDAGESVTVTVDRTESQGKVVMTKVTESAIGTTDNVSVDVDGEAAVEAGSYSELEDAFGNEPRYLVVNGEAEANAQVLVAVESFSESQVTVEGDDGGSGTDDGTDDGSDEGSDGGTDDGATDDGGNDTDTGDGTTEDGSDEDGDGDGGGEGLPGFTAIVAIVAALTVVGIRKRV